MSRPATATVVVCTHRHDLDLVDALESLDDPGAVAEIIVVRSEASDETAVPEHLARWLAAHPHGRIVTEPLAGAARARQQGLRAANHDLVLFADDDVVAEPGWAAALVMAMTDPATAAAGGTIVPSFPGGTPAWLPTTLETYYGARRANHTTHRPFGANMALRRSAALEAGGFTVDLGHVGTTPGLHEETDLCDRLAAAGFGIAEAPAAVVRHRVRPDQVSVRWVLRRAWHEGRSDAERSLLRGDADSVVRVAKLVGLVLALPLAAWRPRWRVHVAARLAVNASYLRRVIRARPATTAGQ